jgi:hypothetical protein
MRLNNSKKPRVRFDEVCEYYKLPKYNSHYFRFRIDIACEVASVTKNTSDYTEALKKIWEVIMPELTYDEIIKQYVYSVKVSGRNFYDYGVEGVRSLHYLVELYLSTSLKLEICKCDSADLSVLEDRLIDGLKFSITEDDKEFIGKMFDRFFNNKTTLDEKYVTLCKQYYYEIYFLYRVLGDEISKRLPQRFGIVNSDVKSIFDQLLSDKYGNILDHLWLYCQNNRQENLGAYLGSLLYVLKNNGLSSYDDTIIGEELLISRKQLGIEYRVDNSEMLVDCVSDQLKVQLVFPGWIYNGSNLGKL